MNVNEISNNERDVLLDRYKKEYLSLLDSNSTVRCRMCDYVLLGEEPGIDVLCFDCFVKENTK